MAVHFANEPSLISPRSTCPSAGKPLDVPGTPNIMVPERNKFFLWPEDNAVIAPFSLCSRLRPGSTFRLSSGMLPWRHFPPSCLGFPNIPPCGFFLPFSNHLNTPPNFKMFLEKGIVKIFGQIFPAKDPKYAKRQTKNLRW
jgi:hypothetical protein